MHPSERISALKGLPILTELSQARLEQVTGMCRWRDYDAGEEIFSYNDLSSEVFFLATGKVRIIVYSADGKAVLFTDLKAAAVFGEISAIDRAPRSAGVEAIERSTIASLTATQFETLLLADPVVAVATIRHVTGEVRRLSERVFEFSTLVVQNRIHAELLRLAADVHQENGQALLSPAPSLSDIANRISTHREAVSRELSRLASIGLLRREGGDLRVSDLARLTKLVREARRE